MGIRDVGYAPALVRTGFHPIDGAHYVLANTGNHVLAGLVSHHSYTRIEARLRGFTKAMDRFAEPDVTLADALAYCDMTVGRQGQPMSVDGRLADIHQRYEATHVVEQAVTEARPLLLAAVGRTEARIRAAMGDRLHPPSTTRTFHDLTDQAGLPRMRLHGLRHTHATLLLKAGENTKVATETPTRPTTRMTTWRMAHDTVAHGRRTPCDEPLPDRVVSRW